MVPKDTRTTPGVVPVSSLLTMLTYFTPCAGVYIVSFEQLNAGLEKYHCRLCEVSIRKIAFRWLILFVDSSVSYRMNLHSRIILSNQKVTRTLIFRTV